MKGPFKLNVTLTGDIDISGAEKRKLGRYKGNYNLYGGLIVYRSNGIKMPLKIHCVLGTKIVSQKGDFLRLGLHLG